MQAAGLVCGVRIQQRGQGVGPRIQQTVDRDRPVAGLREILARYQIPADVIPNANADIAEICK
jgi:hypothetical protein